MFTTAPLFKIFAGDSTVLSHSVIVASVVYTAEGGKTSALITSQKHKINYVWDGIFHVEESVA